MKTIFVDGVPTRVPTKADLVRPEIQRAEKAVIRAALAWDRASADERPCANDVLSNACERLLAARKRARK